MDVFSRSKRSEIMSLVRTKNTKPEMMVRSFIHRLGYRYSLHKKELPGKPDIVMTKYRKIIFVNGCFWHGHKGCPRGFLPSSNKGFWKKKIASNALRDSRNLRKLRKDGWKVLTIWECQLNSPEMFKRRICKFLEN